MKRFFLKFCCKQATVERSIIGYLNGKFSDDQNMKTPAKQPFNCFAGVLSLDILVLQLRVSNNWRLVLIELAKTVHLTHEIVF